MAQQYNYGSDGRTGSINIGNTCYLNSVIQALGHTDPLRHWFITQPIGLLCQFLPQIPGQPINPDGWLGYYVGMTMRQMWANKFSSVRLNCLKIELGRENPQFAGNYQCDAQELLNTVFQALLRDLRRAQSAIGGMQIGVPDPHNIHSMAATSWATFKVQFDSVIADLFYHQIVAETICGNPKCGKPRYRFDEQNTFILPINATRGRVRSLTDMISEYGQEQQTETPRECDFCNTKTQSRFSTRMWKPSRILVIAPNRFAYSRAHGDTVKVDAEIRIQVQGLNLAPGMHPQSPYRNNAIYDLYAVVNHEGKSGAGHYTTEAKTSHGALGLGWRDFNDNVVQDIRPLGDPFTSRTAYLLFYRRRE